MYPLINPYPQHIHLALDSRWFEACILEGPPESSLLAWRLVLVANVITGQGATVICPGGRPPQRLRPSGRYLGQIGNEDVPASNNYVLYTSDGERGKSGEVRDSMAGIRA